MMVEPYCKEQNDLEVRKGKTTRMTDYLFKFIYFCGSTAWGYYIMKDLDFMPRALGGDGNVALSVSPVYNPHGKHDPRLKHYILITSGYHVA